MSVIGYILEVVELFYIMKGKVGEVLENVCVYDFE